MRSVELLVNLYPDKTGEQILKIHKSEIEANKRSYERDNKRTLKFIEDVNTNGGYYRGRFGLDQHYYYSFSDLRLENGKVLGKCEAIVCFKSGGVSDGTKIERRVKDFYDISTYGLSSEERITKDEYDKVSKYIDEIFEKFW